MPIPAIRLHMNTMKRASEADLSAYAPENAARVRRFHASLPGYAPTPLVSLPALAGRLGIKHFLVKDESRRFGLNAFKVLGSSWAVGRYLGRLLGRDGGDVEFARLASPESRAKTGDITFITATDGNHGRGLARTARLFGYPCIVLMPAGSEQIRVDNIRAEGAECRVTDRNYDATVRLCRELAAEHGYVPVQDTDWEGYTDIPALIMQGYATLAHEALEQMRALEATPTHCLLQAGVGSFAGAIAACLITALGRDAPRFIVVEPHAADCHYQSALIGDGAPHPGTGDLRSIMAGLACGEPCTLSWDILRDHADAFLTCADHVAATGMRMLAAPLPGDTPVLSGESGASAAGAAGYLLRREACAAMRAQLGLGPDSTVFVISTEGDTAPHVYRRAVWDGGWPDPE